MYKTKQSMRIGARLIKLMALVWCIAVGGAVWADDAEDFLEKAKKLYGKDDLKGAVIELKNALQEDPSLEGARNLLGQIYLRAGDGESAHKELSRAKALGAEGFDLELDLANAYLLRQRFDKVLQQLPAESDLSETQKARLLTLRGLARIGLEDIERAAEDLQLAAQLTPDEEKPVLGLVQIDLQKNDVDTALMRLNRLLERQPENRPALLLKAELDKRSARLEDALQTYGQLLQFDPKDPQALLGRASIYLARGKLQEAEQDLDRAAEKAPDAVMTIYLRGLLAYRKGELETASEHLLKVLGAAPGHVPSQLLFGVVSFSKGEYEFADEYLSRVYGSFPGNLAVAKLLAATRLKNNDPNKSIEVLEPLLAQQGEDVQLLALLGSAYLQSGDNAKGAELMQRAVELNPDRAGLRTQLALGLLSEGDTTAAVDQLKSAVDLGQDLIQADVLLVMAYLKKQQFDEALQVSQALETRMSDSPIPYNLTGLAYLAKGEEVKATERFNKALEIDPGFMVAESNLARIDLRKKDLDAAQKRFRKILKENPTNLTALLGLARITEQRGDMAELERLLVQARDKNPGAARPGILLARLYLKLNQPLKALAVANDLAARSPDTPAVLEVLGRSQGAAGEINSAVRSFQRLAELNPTAGNFLLLGRTQTLAMNFDSARQSLRKALELEEDSLAVKVSLVNLEIQTGDNNAALLLAQEIQKGLPDSPVGYQLEAKVRQALGELEKTAEAYERAYKLSKSSSVAQNLAAVYRRLGRSQQAEETLRDWLGQQPDDLGSRMVLALLLQDQNQHPEALREYEAIQAKAGNNAIVLNNLAWIYLKEGDERALQMAEQAYNADPGRPEVADTYGWILYKQGNDPERAIGLLQDAYIALPTNGEVGYHVAVVLNHLGRNAEAARTLRRILDAGQPFAEREEAEALLRSIGKQ